MRTVLAVCLAVLLTGCEITFHLPVSPTITSTNTNTTSSSSNQTQDQTTDPQVTVPVDITLPEPGTVVDAEDEGDE